MFAKGCFGFESLEKMGIKYNLIQAIMDDNKALREKNN